MNSIRAAALVALVLSACNLSNPGFDAPVGTLAYPIAIALSDPNAEGGPAYLYVANSNFDLRYNGGSVQAYDLAALENTLRDNKCLAEEADAGPVDDAGAADADAGADAEIDAADDAGVDGAAADADLDAGPADPDAELGDAEVSEAGAPDAAVDAHVQGITIDAGAARDDTHTAKPILCDGRGTSDPNGPCCFGKREVLDGLRASEIRVDSFASGVTTSPDGAHVYVPVRSQSRLLFLDVDEDGMLSCGSQKGRCRRGPKYGKKAEIDDLKYPALPTAVVTGSFAELHVTSRREKYFAATSHDKGELSLFALDGSGSPNLLYTLPGCTTALRCASQPRAASLRLEDGFFLVAAAGGADIARIGARSDIPANEERKTPAVYLYQTQPIAINGLVFNQDIRDVQPDPRKKGVYYALLRGSTGPVIQSVAFLELDQTSPDGRLARAIDAVRVGVGLSKMVQVDLGRRHLLFVSCYQDGEIHVIDADERKTVTVIRDVLGPSDMQIDAARKLLYVTDFRASVIRVIDLHGLDHGAANVPRVVATLGAPYLPGNVK